MSFNYMHGFTFMQQLYFKMRSLLALRRTQYCFLLLF